MHVQRTPALLSCCCVLAAAVTVGFLLVPTAPVEAVMGECARPSAIPDGHFTVIGIGDHDCEWAEMNAMNQLGGLYFNHCRPDKVCGDSAQFGTCSQRPDGKYQVTATGTVACGAYAPF